MDNSEDQTETLPVEKRRLGMTTWIVMAAVVIATLVAIWLVPTEEPQIEDIPLPGQTEMNDSAGDTAPGATTLPPANVEIRSAREFLKNLGDGDVQTVFQEAERQQAGRNLADAYLLYRYAARKGHADAALALGKQSDPAFFRPENSLLPEADIEQAYKWYSLAARAGSTAAVRNLTSLRRLAEQRAHNGDEQAQRLMLQWK